MVGIVRVAGTFRRWIRPVAVGVNGNRRSVIQGNIVADLPKVVHCGNWGPSDNSRSSVASLSHSNMRHCWHNNRSRSAMVANLCRGSQRLNYKAAPARDAFVRACLSFGRQLIDYGVS